MTGELRAKWEIWNWPKECSLQRHLAKLCTYRKMKIFFAYSSGVQHYVNKLVVYTPVSEEIQRHFGKLVVGQVQVRPAGEGACFCSLLCAANVTISDIQVNEHIVCCFDFF